MVLVTSVVVGVYRLIVLSILSRIDKKATDLIEFLDS
jgi:hypothetical protein